MSMHKKNIYILSVQTITSHYMPLLWPSSKTYYEKYGKYPERYNWINPICEVQYENTLNSSKSMISENPPDFFGVSLYVWNFRNSIALCEWVKKTWPNCIIVTGGPQQYFKHHKDWFEKYSFVDASLPSEVYGELAMTDILDNWDFDTNKVDWSKVEQIVFPTNDRSIAVQSPKQTYKRDFKWDFSAFKEQKTYLDAYVKYLMDKRLELLKNFNHIKTKQIEKQTWISAIPSFSWKLETTRGCPYACTFCDWGGGVMSKVIKKELKYIKEDIDIIASYGKTQVYICDANFGINGERDIEITKYIASKKNNKKKRNISLLYGGYAKTNLHFDILKEIFSIEAENDLSQNYKISLQSKHEDVLKNIKRTDLRDDEHYKLSTFLKNKYNHESWIELIVGLPGITIDKWYEEYDDPYLYQTEVIAYEWHLLPESEAYSQEYRDQFKLDVVRRLPNLHAWEIPSEMVVGSYSYSNADYKNMWIIHFLNTFLTKTGVYEKVIKDLVYNKKVSFSKILRKMFEEVYPKWKNSNTSMYEQFQNIIDESYSNITTDKVMPVGASFIKYLGKSEIHNVLLSGFFVIDYFLRFNTTDPILRDALIDLGGDLQLIDAEYKMIVNPTNVEINDFTNIEIYKENIKVDRYVTQLQDKIVLSSSKGLLRKNTKEFK